MLTRMVKGKQNGKTTSIGWTVLLLTITALLVAGCGASTGGPQAPTRAAREPFSARRESEDGAIVAWSGYKAYEPGAETAFDIAIKNETAQTWHGRYCLQLLDGQLPRVNATLEQRAFTLEPGVGFSDTITVRFPEGLGEGAYGLSLAVRRPGGPMVDLVPIQIDETKCAVQRLSGTWMPRLTVRAPAPQAPPRRPPPPAPAPRAGSSAGPRR